VVKEKNVATFPIFSVPTLFPISFCSSPNVPCTHYFEPLGIPFGISPAVIARDGGDGKGTLLPLGDSGVAFIFLPLGRCSARYPVFCFALSIQASFAHLSVGEVSYRVERNREAVCLLFRNHVSVSTPPCAFACNNNSLVCSYTCARIVGPWFMKICLRVREIKLQTLKHAAY
jgi:hypothetical protein